VLLIGPEGSFSGDELKRQVQRLIRLSTLNHVILRTTIVALAAISACRMLWGNFPGSDK